MMNVETQNLSKSYTQGHEQILVLEEVNFSVGKGEFVSVVGPSGSGKSTLLNIIGLLDDVYSGTLKLFSRSVSSLSETEKAKLRLEKLGFVFQFDSLLEEFTVAENVEMPAKMLKKEDMNYSLKLLERFGVPEIADKFPMEISGGEKQRAVILRALRNSPSLVLADEPTGNLDRHNAKTVLEDLRRISFTGVSIIMVTHNEEAARRADKIYRLSGGKLVEI